MFNCCYNREGPNQPKMDFIQRISASYRGESFINPQNSEQSYDKAFFSKFRKKNS